MDFGLSFIRAGQDSNRYLITEEMERKAEHNIVRDVIRAYWNTISADKLIKKYDPLLVEVDKALNDSQKIEELLLTKPMDALLYQKELLDIQRALQSQKGAKSDDANEFALRLLMTKALDENGTRLFNVGEIDVLKNEVRDADLQILMLAVINTDADDIDPKS